MAATQPYHYYIFLSGVSYSETNYKSSIKVFILAGQSNMTGNGVVSHKDKYHNHGKGNLEWCMAYSDSAAKMKHLKEEMGNGLHAMMSIYTTRRKILFEKEVLPLDIRATEETVILVQNYKLATS